MKNNYEQLHQLSKTCATYQSIVYLLEWDQETYMPPEATAFRAEQCALLAEQTHKQRTSGKFAKMLGQLIDLESGVVKDRSLLPAHHAALREWRRDFLKATKLPNRFVKTFALTTSQACPIWAEAKKESKFSHFSRHLEKIVKLNQKKADYLGFQNHPYDALLDLYEPGMTTERLTPLFDRLKTALSQLVKKMTKSVDHTFLHQEFNPDHQMEFGKKLLAAMGFVAATARLDLSAHPFCTTIHPTDTRMTTRIFKNDLMSNLFSVIHEGGHGLYHQGLPADQFGSPLGDAVSLGIDESQSRWWETRIGRSQPFWRHFYPQLQQTFPQLRGTSLEQFYTAINRVAPSLIRVEADEVTYCLHVIIRYEIEKGLIEGSIRIKEIPEIWNQKMNDYLGITPTSDREGCLQDIHWALGAIGYFPTYALGNLYAAQFFNAFEKSHVNWEEIVAEGDLSFIREWLRSQIHQWGRQFSPEELVKRVSGEPLNEAVFIDYLTKKYRSIYDF